MIRPELHYVPRPYMDSTGYKDALRNVHEGAQQADRKQDRPGTRRSPETARSEAKRTAA